MTVELSRVRQDQTCQAYIKFDGRTMTIIDSMNISSIKDNTNASGAPINRYGSYMAYFKEKMNGTNWCVVAPSTWGGASEWACTVSVLTKDSAAPHNESMFLGCVTSYNNPVWAGSKNIEACVFGELE